MAEPQFELRPALTYATHDGVALAGDLYLPKRPAGACDHRRAWRRLATAV